MAEDVRALLDHLDLGRADVMGYSMGARITAFLALAHPQRVRRVVLGGLGIHLVDGVGLPESIAEALEAPSLADVHDPMGRTFRAFAEQTKSDLKALAACIRGSRQTLTRDQVAAIRAPVLVAVGSKDTVAGSAHELAALLPAGRALDIPGRDHMLAVGDKVFKDGVLRFLADSPQTFRTQGRNAMRPKVPPTTRKNPRRRAPHVRTSARLKSSLGVFDLEELPCQSFYISQCGRGPWVLRRRWARRRGTSANRSFEISTALPFALTQFCVPLWRHPRA